MGSPLHISFGGSGLEAGCDEAGRGCLAGPVFAAAVILPGKPDPFLYHHLKDSKKLSPKQRTSLRALIVEQALSYGVAMVDHATIDRINILQASFKAMHLALEQLDPQPALVLVDGNRFKPYKQIPHACIVGGDASYLTIAAASVLAKTARDAYMEAMHEAYPCYGWDSNKGYPTKAHRAAILQYGISPFHRLSFGGLAQLQIGLTDHAADQLSGSDV